MGAKRDLNASGRILVIVGDPGMREACRQALESGGFFVGVAATSQEGLRQVRDGRFDLVLLDWAMPDARRVELLSSIHEIDADIVCIVVADPVTVERAVQVVRAGAYDVVSKSVTAQMLVATVNQGLEKRRLALEARRRRALEQETAELARAKMELERMEQFRTAFVRMAAHEIRAPVVAIQSLLTTLLKGYASPDQQHDFLQRAVERAKELLNMVDDLVSLSAVAAEKDMGRRETLCPADVLDKVFPSLKTDADAKGVTCTVEIDRRPLVEAHPDQLAQLWTNLISNAIKYTRPGGQVRIRLEEKDQWAVGTVEDTGIGIAAEYQPQIFEEFFRTPQAKQMNPRGTGLGLPLVKRIVEGHHGTIKVESAAGKGSRFTFRLPLATSLPSQKVDPSG